MNKFNIEVEIQIVQKNMQSHNEIDGGKASIPEKKRIV